MPFQKYTQPKYPVRQWLIEGEPGSGKSTFVTQMQTPQLIVDADHRWAEVAPLVTGEIFQLSDNPLDHISADRISELVSAGIQGSGVKSIIVDSLTPIIAPLVTRAFRDNQSGANRNKVAAYADKATAMRLLQDTLTGTGCHIAWIYHIYTSRNAQAREVESTSITELELARVLRSCNMRIRLEQRGPKFVAIVAWARNGRSDIVIEDETGGWIGMPEAIEAAVFDNITAEEAVELAGPPARFNTPVEAIRWGMDQPGEDGQSVFQDEAHAQNAYGLVREVKAPANVYEMRNAWVAEVQARQAGGSTITEEERTALQADSEVPTPPQPEAPPVAEEVGS